MLEDLKECIEISRQRVSLIPLDQPFNASAEIWQEVEGAYRSAVDSDRVMVVNNSLVLITPNDAFLTVSAQEIPRCWAVGPYALAIKAYEVAIDNLARALGYSSRGASGLKDLFQSFGTEQWRTTVGSEKTLQVENAVRTGLGLTEVEQRRFLRFLEDREWSGVVKTFDRGDWGLAAIQAVGGWLAVGAARRGELSVALANSRRFGELMETAADSMHTSSAPSAMSVIALKHPDRLKGGENVLYYGAPGTGKSFTANALGDEMQARTFRTVFHPDMQNSDFVGALKPSLDANGAVTYEFRPGPFARALRFARDNPAKRVHLVVEELNRAMAAAVFGELFQLLDRDADGASEYSVDAPSDEFATWYGEGAIALPSNLWILATMNSADQGVYPLDTAFRRRWRQEYVRIDYTKAPDVPVTLATGGEGEIKLPWRQFVENLNAFLTARLDIPEDRLVGPRFVKESELAGGRLPGKLLIYLWDDLLRHHGRHTLFQTSIKSYGQLDSAAANGLQFLDNAFLATLLPEVAV